MTIPPGATTRLLVALLVVALVAAPGCSILSLPVQILKGIYNLLFFWAKAPAPDLLKSTAPVVRNGGEPVPLSEAVRTALARAAPGTIYLSRSVSELPRSALRAPFPGAVPVVIRVRGHRIPRRLLDRLAAHGLVLSTSVPESAGAPGHGTRLPKTSESTPPFRSDPRRS